MIIELPILGERLRITPIFPRDGHSRKKTSRTKACLIAAATAMFFGPAFATEAYHTGTLQYVYPLANGSFIIAFTTNPSGCSSTTTPYKYLYVASGQNSVTADGVKNMLATSLTAFALGRTLSIAYDDATSNCYVNRMTVE